MRRIKVIKNPKVDEIFALYPDSVRDKMQLMRDLVIETAEETVGIDVLEETLRWGEPSYITKIGSTLRMDWKEKTPNQYGTYFQCTSLLVDTFRTVFGNSFQYDGNRALVFSLNQTIPEIELKQCIRAALTYHKVKHLKTLGM